MSDGLLLGPWVDLVLGITLLEGAALVVYHRATGRGPAPRDYLVNMVAGLFLMLALRALVHGAGSAWVGACLLGAGIAHAGDIAMRWRRGGHAAVTTRRVAA